MLQRNTKSKIERHASVQFIIVIIQLNKLEKITTVEKKTFFINFHYKQPWLRKK